MSALTPNHRTYFPNVTQFPQNTKNALGLVPPQGTSITSGQAAQSHRQAAWHCRTSCTLSLKLQLVVFFDGTSNSPPELSSRWLAVVHGVRQRWVPLQPAGQGIAFRPPHTFASAVLRF